MTTSSKNPYRVKWYESALNDLRDIIAFIQLDSAYPAKRIYRSIRKKAQSLCQNPNRGRIVPEFAKTGIQKYREIVLSPYRIIYTIEEQIVFIVMIIDGRRDLKEILSSKMIRP